MLVCHCRAIAPTGEVSSNITMILGAAVTETLAGQLSAGLSYFFDVTTPAKTMNDVGTAGSGLSKQDVADAMRLTPAGVVETGSVDERLTAGGAGPWTTATGFAVPGDMMDLTAQAVDDIWTDARALALSASVADLDKLFITGIDATLQNKFAKYSGGTALLMSLTGRVSGGALQVRSVVDGTTVLHTFGAASDPTADNLVEVNPI